MISKKTIKKYKLDTASLKVLFTADKPKKGVRALVELIADRQREGKERSLFDYKQYAAIDMAYDAPLNNATSSILRSILDKGGTEKEIFGALQHWGLNPDCLFCETKMENGNSKWTPNYPMLYNVTIPLVRAYLTIRHATIFNERNVSPLFDYQPSKYNAENRVLCEIWTDLIESIATDYGYSSTLRDFIFNPLMYSLALKFPMESWDVQEQEGADGEEYIEKEGIRYVVPHITRIYYDLNFPLHTINTGTGCSFAGYWTIMRWGDVESNELYWNTEHVPHGTNWLDPNAAWANYFQQVYPCTLDFPIFTKGRRKETDREKMIGFYGKNDYDSAFFVGYQFVQLVPSEWDLGEYDHKVWMKFTIGADDVIMFAETFGYRPVDYIGYDADSGRGRNPSLAQEIQPSQDMASNILCQYLSTIKRNLANITFYNTEAVDTEQIKELNRRSQSQYQQINFIGFDAYKMEKAGVDLANVFKSMTFPYANTAEILQSFNTVLSILERTLVMSAQEIGAAASHQQGNKEIEIISGSTSNRVAYTASFVDEGIDAWKRQLVEAALCHMTADEVEAQISADIPDLDKHLEELGFERKDESPSIGQKTITVTGKLSKLKLTQFVSRRADKDRKTDMGAAQAMNQAIAEISRNQVLSGVVDPTSLIELAELAAKLAGADDDFKLRLNQNAVASDQLQKAIQQIEQTIMQQVAKTVTQPAAQALAQESAKVDAIEKNVETLTGIVENLKKALSPGQPSPAGDIPTAPTAAPPLPPQSTPQPTTIPVPPNGPPIQ
jgi:hypothetical protein